MSIEELKRIDAVKIGTVEMYRKDAENLYTNGKRYLVTYRRIYAIDYSTAQRTFYGREIYRVTGKGNLALKGRFHAFTAGEVNHLLGYSLLNED